MRVHESGVELDPSPGRLDLDTIERWLATESYWAAGRRRDRIERSIANSMVYGLYAPAGQLPAGDAGRRESQIGFFRIVTDKATFAWLCDVFLETTWRGRGLALWALPLIRDDLLAMGIYRILLATADAHGLYEKVGFTPPAEPQMWMELTKPREQW